MTEQTITITLTVQEARALRNCASIFMECLDIEVRRRGLVDGDRSPKPGESACMKLETALVLEGAEL